MSFHFQKRKHTGSYDYKSVKNDQPFFVPFPELPEEAINPYLMTDPHLIDRHKIRRYLPRPIPERLRF